MGFIISVLSVWIGSVLVKHFAYPVVGIPFVLGGGISGFFFFIYMIGEYEEDDAEVRSISEIANSHIQGLDVRIMIENDE